MTMFQIVGIGEMCKLIQIIFFQTGDHVLKKK